MDRFTSFLDRVVEAIEDLSQRDRRIALILLSLVTLVLLGGVTWGLQSVLADRASRVVAVKDHLIEAQDLGAEYEQLAARLGDVEARMGQFKPTQVNTYLEGWANASGVVIKEVRDVGAEEVGGYRKRDYRVEIMDAELSALVKFVHAIETSPYPIQVRTARFKAKDRKEGRPLDLQLELVTFSRGEG